MFFRKKRTPKEEYLIAKQKHDAMEWCMAKVTSMSNEQMDKRYKLKLALDIAESKLEKPKTVLTLVPSTKNKAKK